MRLILADGTLFEGVSFGADVSTTGEVVFNTGMTGYVETLTDPSYRGQILVLTYPLQGNYGVPDGPWESERLQVEGLVVTRHAFLPCHHSMHQSLQRWLHDAGVPALEGVDTRMLTRRLRALGTMSATLGREGSVQRTRTDMNDVAKLVTTPGTHSFGADGPRLLLIDCGTKRSLIESLCMRKLRVVRIPFYEPWEELIPTVSAVAIGNGPGDPKDLARLVERIRPLLSCGKPLLGICLGHQLLALAAGADTYKLPYGHRSQNQPVVETTTHRAYLTAQNHGYAVSSDSLPADFIEWFRNLNDKSNEGLRHRHLPIMSVQFHPEAASGPRDTDFVFDRFAQLVMDHDRDHAS